MKILLVVGGAAFLGTLLTLVWLYHERSNAAPRLNGGGAGGAGGGGAVMGMSGGGVGEGAPELVIPPFALVDQEGKAIDQSVLDGQVTIVDFIFTNCVLACPSITANMVDLQKKLRGSGVRFLSFSIDPVNDTPEVFAAYAEKKGVDQSLWRFATERVEGGKMPSFVGRKIFSKDLLQLVEENAQSTIPMKDGGEMNDIVHSPNVFLVGPDRKVLGIFNGLREAEIETLRERANGAALRYLQGKGK